MRGKQGRNAIRKRENPTLLTPLRALACWDVPGWNELQKLSSLLALRVSWLVGVLPFERAFSGMFNRQNVDVGRVSRTSCRIA
jgi:hypothetical protein